MMLILPGHKPRARHKLVTIADYHRNARTGAVYFDAMYAKHYYSIWLIGCCLISPAWGSLGQIRFDDDAESSQLLKRLAAAPNVSKVESVTFLQIHRDAEEAEEGGPEDSGQDFGTNSFFATGSPESILRAMSPVGVENVILEAKLPPGYYRAKIKTQTGNKTEALSQLAKVYRQLFNVEVVQENREIPVLVLKVDPAKAGGIAKKQSNSFISRGHSTNRGRSRISLDGPIAEVQLTLQQELHRTVLDETQLTGSYSVKFEFNNHVTADEKVASVRESLADQGLLLQEVKRQTDCVMVRAAKPKREQPVTKPTSGGK